MAGATTALPAGWYSRRSPSRRSTSTVSPSAISSKRFSSGDTLIVSALPSASFRVRLRPAASFPTTVARNFCERVAWASPAVPVDCTSTGGGFDIATHAARRPAAHEPRRLRTEEALAFLGYRNHPDRAAHPPRERLRNRAVELVAGIGMVRERVVQLWRPDDEEVHPLERCRDQVDALSIEERNLAHRLARSEQHRRCLAAVGTHTHGAAPDDVERVRVRRRKDGLAGGHRNLLGRGSDDLENAIGNVPEEDCLLQRSDDGFHGEPPITWGAAVAKACRCAASLPAAASLRRGRGRGGRRK